MESTDYSPFVLFGTKLPRFILQALFFTLLARTAGGPEMARFALVGNAMGNAAITSLVMLGISMEIEKWSGTLPLLIASPARWLPLMIGRAAAGYVDAMLGVLTTYVVLLPLMAGAGLSVARLLWATPIMLLTIATLSGLGWLLGSITLPMRIGLLVSNQMAYTMFVVCGVNFPLEALPPWLQIVGRALPLTNGLEAMRAVIDGASYLDVAPLLAAEIAIGVVYAAVAWLVFGWRLRATQKSGHLELT